jgi:hypothetical protein
MLLGCTETKLKEEGQMSTTIDRPTVEKLAHVKLPDEASDIYTHTESGIDTAIWLRFQMPCEKRDEFLRQAGYQDPLSTTTRYVKNRQLKTESWWTPESVEPFESGHYNKETDQRYGSHILLSKKTAGLCTVYMFVTSL